MQDPITYVLNKLDNFFQPKYTGPSVKEIAEAMKPVPYEEIADKLPSIEWGRRMSKILDNDKGLEGAVN